MENPTQNPDAASLFPVDVVHFEKAVRDQAWSKSVDTNKLSPERLRVAALLDRSTDVVGWVVGAGHAIAYDWQGHAAQYVPAFIVRARVGETFHNVIIDVRDHLDDRDQAEVRRGRRYCTMLTDLGREPWHYVLLEEHGSGGRSDMTWWEESSADLAGLIGQQEDVALELAEHASCQFEF